MATIWNVRNRANERLTVYQQNMNRQSMDQFVVMGKAWVCWDPRQAVILDEGVVNQ